MGVKTLCLFILLLSLRMSHALEARDFHRIPSGEGRVALVIGNNHYLHANGLQNAVADAEAMKEKLIGLGFDVVYRQDASRKEMNKAIDSFAMKLSANAVGMVFYAGHGIQVNGENYLIPVDLDAQDESDVINDGVNLAKILGQMSGAQAKFSLVILDACRDNPFRYAHIGGRGMATARGLAPISSNARGIMVVYSAGNGQKALDSLGDHDQSPNGLFTREFLRVMERPGVKIQELVDEVRERVIAAAKSVGQTQTPAVYNESMGTFFFLLPLDQKVTITTEPTTVAVNQGNAELEERKKVADKEDQRTFWQSAQANSVSCQAYLSQWPHGTYAALAKQCIDKGDDAKRQAEEARLADLKRQAAESPVQTAPPPVARQSFEPEMVSLPAGSFMMGSSTSEEGHQNNEKQHQVSVSAFSMGKYDVTFAEYDRFTKATKRKKPSDAGWGRGRRPVINVDWNDAVAYAEWLAQQTGKRYRLPTEAEWEYAARAGTTAAYYWGDQASHEYANYGKDECCGGVAQGNDRWVNIAPVGSFAPNPWGLYDMLGNVWQWTCSAYVESYDGSEQRCSGSNDATARRSFRGGSWFLAPDGLRTAYRNCDDPAIRDIDIGFRLVHD